MSAKKWLTLLPLLAVLIAIFCFSAQSAEQSAATSGKVMEVVLDTVVPEFEQMEPVKQQTIRETASHLVRKAAHLTEFGALGFFLLLHLRQWKGSGVVWLWTWLAGTLYAVSDEVHQCFVAGRGPGAVDVCIDSAGVLCGIAMALLLCVIVKKIRNKRA